MPSAVVTHQSVKYFVVGTLAAQGARVGRHFLSLISHRKPSTGGACTEHALGGLSSAHSMNALFLTQSCGDSTRTGKTNDDLFQNASRKRSA